MFEVIMLILVLVKRSSNNKHYKCGNRFVTNKTHEFAPSDSDETDNRDKADNGGASKTKSKQRSKQKGSKTAKNKSARTTTTKNKGGWLFAVILFTNVLSLGTTKKKTGKGNPINTPVTKEQSRRSSSKRRVEIEESEGEGEKSDDLLERMFPK